MHSLLNSSAPGLTRTVLVLRVLLAAFFVFLALKNLLGDARMAADFSRWGYPDGFRIAVAVLQLAGAVGLFVPALVLPSAAMLAVLLVGAVATHLRFDPPLAAAPALVCLLLLAPVLWAVRPAWLR